MTQEEKAKAYDKALEKAKIWKDKSGMPKDKQGILDDIFPELKEGGDDKIIKALKEGFKYHQIFNPTFGGIPCVEIVNWLEKQKSIGEIVERCKDSWYNEGKIQGQIEGLSDEEKYQQGWHDALEQQVPTDKEEDGKIRKSLLRFHKSTIDVDGIKGEDIIAWLEKQGGSKSYSWKPTKEQFEALDYAYNSCSDTERGNYYEGVLETLIEDLHGLEKQGKKPQGKSALELWKDMRLEVYQQASGNRHEPNYSDDTTKMFSLIDIDEIMEKITEKQDEKTQGKSALEVINEVKVDNSNSVKPADKVEPKFKVGDWVVTSYGKVNQVITVDEDGDGFTLDDDTYFSGSWKDGYHLWTIQDAKDGDVLASEDKDKVFLYNGKLDLRGRVCAYCGIYKTYDGLRFTECAIGNYFTYKESHPATREQRDLLFKKMIEDGYEWDAEKKELKEMKVTSSTYCSENCKGYQETGKCFADGECDSKRKYDNMLDSCEIEHIEDGKFYYCIKDYYAGGNKRASKGDVVQAHRGMSMMALGVKANEYFLPINNFENLGIF